MSRDQETEDEAYKILQLLRNSIDEFVDERVAFDARSYTNHFMKILEGFHEGGAVDDLEAECTRFVKALENLEE